MADLNALRASLRAAQAAVAQALYQQSLNASSANTTALAQAQKAARTAQSALNAALAASLTPGLDVATRLQGNLPIALFPVRLETRFVRGAFPVSVVGGARVPAAPVATRIAGSGFPIRPPVAPPIVAPPIVAPPIAAPLPVAVPAGVLQVRIYPDEILAQTHEPELTDDEWQAGRAYWTAGDSLSSWAALLGRFSAQRAAWIVSQASTPTRPPARAASWTRPATAVLPDNFQAFAFRAGTLVASASGSAVVEPLTLTVSPALDATQRVTIPGSNRSIDADLLWTVDFNAAKAAGMGLELRVSAVDWSQGFDLLVVIGTKGSYAPADASQQIQALLDGHHYTRGLALVPPGTPTSNLTGQPSGFPPADPGGASSFAIEREVPPAGDGTLLAQALGVSASVVAHVEQTGLLADVGSKAMLTALWPATLGYHLEQMMAPSDPSLPAPFDANAAASAYDFTRAHVRPQGPLPTFRVGSVPYGVAPVTSVARMAGTAPALLTSALSALRPTLLAASGQAPVLSPASSDPDGDLLNVLRLDASSLAFRVQVMIGSQLQTQLALLPELNGPMAISAQGLQGAIATALLRSLGLPASTAPRIALSSFGTPEPFFGTLVSSTSDRASPLPPAANYIQWILDQLITGGAALSADALPSPYERTLLYQLLRHAVLVEQGRTAHPHVREVEVLGLKPIFSQPLPAAGGAPTEAPAIFVPPPPPPPPVSHLADVKQALQTLADLSVAELERLFTETLDLCSHRFDAWITSLAQARLSALRANSGTHYGAYGWVQNLKPAADPFDPGPGGFIHAPSPNHAQAAAILRNGFLTRGQAGSPQYAVDLSSAHVREGLELLARVRDGESLSEILGTEIETELRADPALAIAFLEPLRTSYPTPSSPILDGLAAILAWRANPSSPHFPTAILSGVSQWLDAAADLLTAESVFQMVRGNPSGAAAGLDALGQGARPPEPQVAQAPVAGTGLTHRVALVLDDTPPPGWPKAATPRAKACRYVDGWLGQLLGDPSRVKCTVSSTSGKQVVTLKQLGLRPIDVVALAGSALDGSSELEARIRQVAKDSSATIDYSADSAWGAGALALPSLLQLARAADALVCLARPLVASDLATASDRVEDTVDPDVAQRAQAALAALETLDLTKPATQKKVLRECALFGLSGAYLPDDATAAEVTSAVQRVDAERKVRLAAAQATADPTEVIRGVFGRRLPMAGSFAVPAAVPPALAGPAGIAPDDADKWLRKATRVRAGLGRWRQARILAEAFGARAPTWDVVQLPYAASSPWWALPFSKGEGPPSGVMSAAIHRPWNTAPTAPWAGLLLEEWSELLPDAAQQTGIAFHYPSPRAEAPQAVLLAVPPVDAATWSTAVLLDVVRETFELSRIRLLTPDALSTLSLLLPATSLSVNSAGDALSTPLWKQVATPLQVVAAI
jgi:hypothetical protein